MNLSRVVVSCLFLQTGLSARAQTLPPATIQYQGRVSSSGTAHNNGTAAVCTGVILRRSHPAR